MTTRLSQDRIEADGETGWERPQAFEREEDAGDERVAGERVMPDREELAVASEEHLLVRDEAGESDAVDRDVAAERACGRLRRAGRGVDLRLVVKLDDLSAREVLRRFGGEAHHEDGAEREVRRDQAGDPGLAGARVQRFQVVVAEAGRADDAGDAGRERALDVRDRKSTRLNSSHANISYA